MSEKRFLMTQRGVARTTKVNAIVLGTRPRTPKQTRRVFGGGSGGATGCDTQNAIIDVILFGLPTAGTFAMVLTINSVAETLTFNWDDSTADVATELATHSQLASSDVIVSGFAFPTGTMRIEFTGTLANTPVSLPLTDWSSLTGGSGVGIVCVLAQLGHS